MTLVLDAPQWSVADPGTIGAAAAILRDNSVPAEDAVVLTAGALSRTLAEAGADSTVRGKLDLLRERPERTGRVIAELRDLISWEPVQQSLRSQLLEAIARLLNHGKVDIIASPVGPVARLDSYHRALSVHSTDEVLEAVRSCWQSLYSEETSYRGRGRFGTEMAVIIAPSKLGLACEVDRFAGTQTDGGTDSSIAPALVPVEDLETMGCLTLGRCEPGYRRMFLKRVWLRRSLQLLALRTYRVFYLVYAREDLASIEPALRTRLRLPYVRVEWGEGWRAVAADDLIETLRFAHARNLLPDGRHACMQVAEVVPAEQQGFATLTRGGGVIIEAFPGGLHGTKDGLFQPSTYELDAADRTIVQRQTRFDVRGAFDAAVSDWRTAVAPPYELVLPEESRRELAAATRRLTDRLGEVRVEWYLYGRRIYIKDASFESAQFGLVLHGNVISPGRVEGTAYRIEDIAAYDRLGTAYDLGVVNRDGQRETALRDSVLQHDLAALQFLDRPVIVAAHASIGLMPLVPHVRGFVFERGSLLSHTAIVLRESRVPAVVCRDAMSRLRTGDRISVDAAGELHVRPVGAGS